MTSMLKRPQNAETLVCIPHNYGGIVWCRDKNFEVPKLFEDRYSEKQNFKKEGFLLYLIVN